MCQLCVINDDDLDSPSKASKDNNNNQDNSNNQQAQPDSSVFSPNNKVGAEDNKKAEVQAPNKKRMAKSAKDKNML